MAKDVAALDTTRGPAPFSLDPQEGRIWASTSAFVATLIFPRSGIWTRNPCTSVHGPLGVGGYNHHDSGVEGEWRPLLLYANPLGHRVPATLFNARFMRNDISGDHPLMIGKVVFVVSSLGGGCTGCVGVNIA